MEAKIEELTAENGSSKEVQNALEREISELKLMKTDQDEYLEEFEATSMEENENALVPFLYCLFTSFPCPLFTAFP